MSTPNPDTDDEYSECLMGSMVTPGEYWLINKSPTHTLEVQQLEQELSDLMEKNTDVPHPDDVNTTDCIAVECPPENGVWKRGRAVSRTGRAVFKVFLVDSGQVVQVTIKRMRVPLDPKFLKVEPLAFKFCLYGIVPCTLYEGKQKVTLKWTDESRYFVSNLLSKKHFFHIKIVQILRRTLLGDIYLFNKRSGQFYSLSRLLCAKNLAVYAESYYKEKVMLLEHSLVDNRYLVPDSEVSIHMDTKLKRMEELRLVNMQHECDWHVQGRRGSNSGSQSDDNEELEESALCDNSSQLAQDLLHNLIIRRNLRSHSASDLPDPGFSVSSDFQYQESDKEVVDGSHDEQPSLESVNRDGSHDEQPSLESVNRDGSHDEQPSLESVNRDGSHNEQPSLESVNRDGSHDEQPSLESVNRDGSHDEQPSLESVNGNTSPTSPMEKPGPRPLMEIEIPMPLIEKPGPRPLMEIEIPMPVMEKPGPRPLMEIEIPMPVMEKPGLRPLMEIEVPMPVMENQKSHSESEKPKPFTIIEFPKPPVGIEIPKPLEGIEFRKPFVGRMSPKPLNAVEFEKPLEGIESPKPLNAVEFGKPLEGIESPKQLEGIEFGKPLEETEIPKQLEGIEFGKPLEETEIPKPVKGIEFGKPLQGIESPKPLNAVEFLKPLEGIEFGKSLEGIEFGKSLGEIEIPKPLEGVEIHKPLAGVEIRKPLEGVEIRKPLVGRQSPKPLNAVEFGKSLKGIEFEKPLEGIEFLKPLEGIEFLNPLEGIEFGKPLEETEIPKPSNAVEFGKSLKGIEFGKPLQGIESPKPLNAVEFLKPLEGIEFGKPLEGIEFGNPLEGIEFGNPLEGIEFGTPLEETEIPKQLEEIECGKPLPDMETPKSVMEKQIPEPLAEMGIVEPDEKDEVSNAGNENNDSPAIEVKEPTDGQKKLRKEFKIFFEEKRNFPTLEVVEFHEVFHVFFDNVLEPLDNFKNLNICKILFKNIERQVKLEQPTPIQRWAIPSIVNGDDLVIIGEPKSGKTLSYILGILEVVKLKMEVGQFHLGKGPLAVILTSSSKTCEFIYRVFSLLTTRRDRKFKVLLCKLNVRFVNNAVVDRPSMPYIVNRCDVLISTPQCLLKILNNRGVSDFKKLNVVVFDGADLCATEPYLTEIKLLLNQSKLPKNAQKIFCGERWTNDFEGLTKVFVNEHSAVIGSYLEAAAYANLQSKVFFIDVCEKDRTLLDLTLQEYKGRKVAIVCNNNEEALHLGKLFKDENKTCSVAYSGSHIEELKNIRYNWGRSKEWCIVVCTHDTVEALGIYNADALINYSLPSDREFSLGDRFLLITNKMKDYIFKRRARPSVDFLIYDKTNFRLPELLDFLERQEIQIPPSLTDKIQEEIEASEQNLPLCEDILKFGNCTEVWKCNKRHFFIKDIDFPAKPLCGIVKFLVLKVHSTTHFSARIIELSDQQNNYNKVTFPDLTLHITRQLRNILRDRRKRIPLRLIKVDALCALNRNDASGMRFHRAKIIEVKTFVHPYRPIEVTVKLIDWGCVLRANVAKLFELPEEMKVYPPLATDVYLCNLVPKDLERDWSDRDISFATNMFMTELEENQIWIGRIKLSLISTLLLDPVKLCHTLDDENTHVIEFSANQKLIYCGIADDRPDHLKTLYALCEKANVDTSIYEYNLEASENSCQPDCAHFDNDFQKIQFIYAESPTSLYVRISKFEDLLISLETECNEDGIRQKKLENCNLNNPVLRKKLSIGMCCLALNGTSWNRARILSFEKDRAKVFFIDYGDTDSVEHVVPIPEKLLIKLPSQAIECYLVGVNPEIEISENVLGEIYDFSKNGSEELCVSVVEKVFKSQATGGWKYGINLLNAEGKSLNKKLIDLGLVQPTSNYLDLAVDMEKKPQIDDANETDADTWDEDFDEDKNKDMADLSRFENLSIVDSASGDDLNKALITPEANDDLSYFLTMESGVFDDDSACCMLEEFLCNLAPEQVNRREPQNEAKTDKKEDESVPENNEVVVEEEEGVDDAIPQQAPQEAPQEAPAKEVVQGDAQLDEAAALAARLNYLSRRRKRVKRTLPYLKYIPNRSLADISKHLVPTDVFTPEILWSQTHTEIEVKIMLTNVATYKFDCTVENFIFRCLLDKKRYVSNVRLFGAVNPEMTRVEVKTFFVQIVFQKLCPLMWPRLCRENKKFRWIKYNIEHFKEKKSTISEILCSQAMERIKSGNIIVPKVTDEIKFVPSSSSEGSDWSDSEGEEV